MAEELVKVTVIKDDGDEPVSNLAKLTSSQHSICCTNESTESNSEKTCDEQLVDQQKPESSQERYVDI